MVWKSSHISTSIAAPAADVYAFVANAENLPRWAAGLSQSTVTRDGDGWVVDSPMGRVFVRFAPLNSYGVVDHHVTLPSGEVVYNPLRVVANDRGCDVVFSLFRRDGMSDEEFVDDARRVQADLDELRRLFEK